MNTIICDIIPFGKIKLLNKYLDNDVFLEMKSLTNIIEIFYGCAMSVNNIQINKLNVIEEIYNVDNRNEYYFALKLNKKLILYS